MRYISLLCVMCSLVAITLTAPLEESVHHQVKRQTSSSPTNSQQETLNRIIAFSNQKLQLLRRLFPQLFQKLDMLIQNATSQVFRVVGGALLRSGGLGAGGSSGGSSGGGRVSVVLPTFPPDEDDDFDDDLGNSITSTPSSLS